MRSAKDTPASRKSRSTRLPMFARSTLWYLMIFVAFPMVMAIAGGLFLPDCHRIPDRVISEANLRSIGAALNAYSLDHGGYLPPVETSRGWVGFLTGEYLRTDPKLLLDPLALKQLQKKDPSLAISKTSYLFNLDVTAAKLADLDPETPLMISDNLGDPGSRPLILTASGTCTFPEDLSRPYSVRISLEPIATESKRGMKP